MNEYTLCKNFKQQQNNLSQFIGIASYEFYKESK